MGLRKLFKQKDLTDEQTKDILENSGATVKDPNNYHRKKFKFGEFAKYAEQKSKAQDNTLRPHAYNNSNGYEYDGDKSAGDASASNLSDSNTGLGYDEYANGYSYDNGNRSNGYERSSKRDDPYSSTKESSRKMGGTGLGANQGLRNGRGDTQRTERSPNAAGSGSYSSPHSNSRTNSRLNVNDVYGSSANTSASAAGNGYGYEPSINIYEPSMNNYEPQTTGNHYGYEPSIAASNRTSSRFGKLSRSNTKATASTYDPYAPGEGHYSKPAVETDDAYGDYDPYDQYNDNATIGGKTAADSAAGIINGVSALQLQEREQEEEQDAQGPNGVATATVFDPYGPAVTNTTENVDLNEYEPNGDAYGQAKYTSYGGDEFEGEEEIDEDEEELCRIQRQTKDVREDTVSQSRRLVSNLNQANRTADDTLGVLGSQREKIYEMENTMGMIKVQQRDIDDNVKDLEHYTRSMFHIQVNNPFTRSSRKRAKEQELLARRQEDRNAREKLNSELYQSQRNIMGAMDENGNGNGSGHGNGGDFSQSNLHQKYDYEQKVKDASKYLTKDHDEEDERHEVEIARNFEIALKGAQNLRRKAELMNREIGNQSNSLKNVSENVDKADDKIALSTRRIRGI